jgi:hypothetical protein
VHIPNVGGAKIFGFVAYCNAGFAKEIDHLSRVAEIEKHLGIEK